MDTKIKAYWLGHSAFKFVTEKDTVILVDPFLSSNPTTPKGEKKQKKVDFILLTHGHEDHVGDTLDIAKETGCKVVSIVELSGLLKKHGLKEDQAVEFNKGGTIKFDEFSVTLTNANHSSSFGGEYAGDPAGLVIKFDDITIYHAGDTNIMPDFFIYNDLYKPDISILPIGDHYTMGPAEAALSASMIKSRYAVPCHYGTFGPLTGDPKDFKKETERLTDGKTTVLIPKAGEEFLTGK